MSKVTEKQIEDIWLFNITAQFLLDHAESSMLNQNWCGRDTKASLKTCIDKLIKITSIPFVQREVNVSSDAVDQHFTGSILAEQNMRLCLSFNQLPKSKQKQFQGEYEKLLSKFNLKID